MEPEDLIIRYFTGELSAEEQEQLLAVLESDSGAMEVFREYSEMQQSMPVKDNDYTVAYKEFLEKAVPAERKARTVKVMPAISLAAAAVAAILFVVYFTLPQKQESTFFAAIGQNESLQLPDNSEVQLHLGSELAYITDFTENREVVLRKGEAYFEVEKDTAHPFRVTTPDAVITVHGTGFNVKIDSMNHTTSVTVLHGKVSVAAKESNEIEYLGKKQKAVLAQGAKFFTKPENASENELSWFTNKLVFKSCPMPEVIQSLNNHFGSNLVIEGNSLDSCKLNATIDDPDLQEIIEMLKVAFEVQLTKKDNKQILKGPGC